MKQRSKVWSSDDAPLSSNIGVYVEEYCQITFVVYDENTDVSFEDGVTTLGMAFTDQALIKSTMLMCQAVRAMLRTRGLPIPAELGREST